MLSMKITRGKFGNNPGKRPRKRKPANSAKSKEDSVKMHAKHYEFLVGSYYKSCEIPWRILAKTSGEPRINHVQGSINPPPSRAPQHREKHLCPPPRASSGGRPSCMCGGVEGDLRARVRVTFVRTVVRSPFLQCAAETPRGGCISSAKRRGIGPGFVCRVPANESGGDALRRVRRAGRAECVQSGDWGARALGARARRGARAPGGAHPWERAPLGARAPGGARPWGNRVSSRDVAGCARF